MSREQSTLLQEGEKMKNESVKHVRYGTGRVAEVVQNHMVVLFDGEAGRKVFPYPDAFERFLCFDDPILQKRAEAAVMELKKKRTEEAKQRLVVYQLYEAKRKQEQMPMPPIILVSSLTPTWRSSILVLNTLARSFTSSLKSILPSAVK